MTRTPKPQKTPSIKAMDYLARRDHSEKELIEKLSKHFPMEEIEPALAEIKKRGWLLSPEELAHKVSQNLHRKNKGHLYIQHFLREKGLPRTEKDPEMEMAKARDVLETKSRGSKEPKRMASLLKNRGFDTETISRMIHEIRRNSPSLY